MEITRIKTKLYKRITSGVLALVMLINSAGVECNAKVYAELSTDVVTERAKF